MQMSICLHRKSAAEGPDRWSARAHGESLKNALRCATPESRAMRWKTRSNSAPPTSSTHIGVRNAQNAPTTSRTFNMPIGLKPFMWQLRLKTLHVAPDSLKSMFHSFMFKRISTRFQISNNTKQLEESNTYQRS